MKIIIGRNPLLWGAKLENIINKGSYGFSGTGTGDGLSTLTKYFTNYTFTHNAIIGGRSNNYPAENFFPSDSAAVKFEDYDNGDYSLSSSSPYKNAGTDGKDIGAIMMNSISPPQGLRIIQ